MSAKRRKQATIQPRITSAFNLSSPLSSPSARRTHTETTRQSQSRRTPEGNFIRRWYSPVSSPSQQGATSSHASPASPSSRPHTTRSTNSMQRSSHKNSILVHSASSEFESEIELTPSRKRSRTAQIILDDDDDEADEIYSRKAKPSSGSGDTLRDIMDGKRQSIQTTQPSSSPKTIKEIINLDSNTEDEDTGERVTSPPLTSKRTPFGKLPSEDDDEDDELVKYIRHKSIQDDDESSSDSKSTPRGKRMRKRQESPVGSDAEPVGRVKRRRSLAEEGEEEPVKRGASRSKRRPVLPEESEEDDLELDYDEELEKRNSQRRLSAKEAALQKLRARKAAKSHPGSSSPIYNDSSPEDEESELDDYTGNLDEESDEDLDDFIVDGDNGEGGEAIVLPAEFRMSSNKPEDVFKCFLEFLVHTAIDPKYPKKVHKKTSGASKYEHYLLAIRRIADRLEGHKRGLISSEAWQPEFRAAVEKYPKYSTFIISAGICNCQACQRTNRLATRRVVLSDDPYDRDTLESLPDSDDEEEGDCTFLLGRFCAARSELYHRLHHYKLHTFHRVEIEVQTYRNTGEEEGPGYGPNATPKEMFQQMVDQGFFDLMYGSFEGLIEEAENFGVASAQPWGQHTLDHYIE
ncbi:hypothetical protein HDV00_010485 [Rhizophlyctis rosea]|nr:hypothetical protein HDV00_010485 [Rhizophlyctis rosea]